MKIVFFTSYTATPHFETELELIESYLKDGHEIIQITCNRTLDICYLNPKLDKATCWQCISKRNFGVEQLSKKIKSIDISKYFEKSPPKISVKNLDELKSLKIENFEIGYAVLSNLIDITRTTDVDLKANFLLFNRIYKSTAKVYYAFEKIIESEKPDLVYVFNGRSGNESAAVASCKKLGVNFYTHERGNSKDFYATFQNQIPHESFRLKNSYESLWDQGENDKLKKGSDFFEEKINRKDRNWFSYVNDQEFGELPETWDNSKINIVIFNTSNFEIFALGKGWDFKLYKDQLEIIETLEKKVSEDSLSLDFDIYLRIHPNIKNHFYEEERIIEALGDSSRIKIISSKSSICSYSMLLKSNIVLTFGSTMGVEATYFKKPSILIGPSFYDNLDCTYKIDSIEDFLDLIKNGDTLLPKPQLNSIKYGFHFQTFGKRFVHYNAHSLFEGTFKNKNLNNSSIWTVRTKIRTLYYKVRSKLNQ